MTDPRMTPTNDAPVTVEQCDREAAAVYGAKYLGWNGDVTDAILSGRADGAGIVQTLARHRLAALASAPAGDGDTSAEDAIMAGRAVMSGEGDGTYDEAVAAIEGLVNALARPRAAVGEEAMRVAYAPLRSAQHAFDIIARGTPHISAVQELAREESQRIEAAILALQSPPAKVGE